MLHERGPYGPPGFTGAVGLDARGDAKSRGSKRIRELAGYVFIILMLSGIAPMFMCWCIGKALGWN